MRATAIPSKELVATGRHAFARARTRPRLLSSSCSGETGLRIVYPEEQQLVALVHLSRPSRMNALSFEMGDALVDLENRLLPSTRAVVFAGEGEKAFSTGRDLKDSKNHTQEDAKRYMRLARDSVLAIKRLDLPKVAAITGFAFGWGMELALACDLRVARHDAILCFPECGLGIFPGAAGTVLLPRLVGPGVAKDLILTSRRFTGEEALSLRVVNRSIKGDAQDTRNAAVELATQIAGNGPLGVKGARKVIDEGLDMTFEQHVNLSDTHRLPLNDTEDFREALRAFDEKRKPNFVGR